MFFRQNGPIFSIYFETVSYCHKGDEQGYYRNIPKSSHTKNQKVLGIRINDNKVSLCFFPYRKKKNCEQDRKIIVKFEQNRTGLNVFGQN